MGKSMSATSLVASPPYWFSKQPQFSELSVAKWLRHVRRSSIEHICIVSYWYPLWIKLEWATLVVIVRVYLTVNVSVAGCKHFPTELAWRFISGDPRSSAWRTAIVLATVLHKIVSMGPTYWHSLMVIKIMLFSLNWDQIQLTPGHNR